MKIAEKQNFIIAFNGDSITHGGRGSCMDCNHIMGHGFQEMAAAEIGLKYSEKTPRFYNKGVSGQGLHEMALKWDEDILPFKPDLLSILIGINDRKTYAGPEKLAQWEEEYRNLLKKTLCVLPETKIILMEPFYFGIYAPKNNPYRDVPHPLCEKDFPIPCRTNTPEEVSLFEDTVFHMQIIVRRLASDYHLSFVETQKPLSLASEKTPIQYITWDGVHPTMVGHRILADEWLKTAENLLLSE